MIDFIQWVGAVGGIGAVFAVLMFLVLMKVMRIMRDDRKYMEDRETAIIDAYNKAAQESTKIQTELLTYLRLKNGKN